MGKDARICISLCLRAHGSLGSGLGGLFSQGLPFSQSLAVSRRAGKQSASPVEEGIGLPSSCPRAKGQIWGSSSIVPI